VRRAGRTASWCTAIASTVVDRSDWAVELDLPSCRQGQCAVQLLEAQSGNELTAWQQIDSKNDFSARWPSVGDPWTLTMHLHNLEKSGFRFFVCFCFKSRT
jgi:hypothetical protein